ncbi:ECF RNA polymerase sigma factor SigK [Amycolatopsis lurida]
MTERPAPEVTTEELLTRVGRGDDGAFELCYERLAGPIFRVACRILRNRSQAEEVTQEVMIDLWRTARRYSADRGTAAGWALTLAHRRAVDRVRSEQTAGYWERRAPFAAGHDIPFDEVAERVVIRDERDRIRACLDRLTDLQRESVTMAYYQGHAYAEVAAILGRPVGTIKTRIRDGLTRLRDSLEGASADSVQRAPGSGTAMTWFW